MQRLKEILLKKHSKQYYCHIQFVVEIALRLCKKLNADREIVEIAAMLHDIGRDNEINGETHYEAGKRIANKILSNTNINNIKKEKILQCIVNHDGKEEPSFLEESIIITADAGSKVEFHEAFILMCKKESYKEKLNWGQKYLEQGFSRIKIDSYLNEITKKYQELKSIYAKIK